MESCGGFVYVLEIQMLGMLSLGGGVQAINISFHFNSIYRGGSTPPDRCSCRYWVGCGKHAWWANSLLLSVASAAGRILANFIISGAEHEYLDPCTTTCNTNSNPQNWAEILLDLWHNDDRNLHEW
jgi:hypothetical protein